MQQNQNLSYVPDKDFNNIWEVNIGFLVDSIFSLRLPICAHSVLFLEQ